MFFGVKPQRVLVLPQCISPSSLRSPQSSKPSQNIDCGRQRPEWQARYPVSHSDEKISNTLAPWSILFQQCRNHLFTLKAHSIGKLCYWYMETFANMKNEFTLMAEPKCVTVQFIKAQITHTQMEMISCSERLRGTMLCPLRTWKCKGTSYQQLCVGHILCNYSEPCVAYYNS